MNRLQHLRILFGVFLIACLPCTVLSQELMVKGMSLTTDQTANLSENMLRDNNGDYAGLVKVMLAAPSADFEGWVLKKLAHTASEHWVFMAKGSTRLKVTVPGFLPLEIDFRHYGINGIESRRTYKLTIAIPQSASESVDDGMRYLKMRVEPKNSVVYVDGELQSVDGNGELSVYLPIGRHTYTVSAKGYATQEGTVDLTGNTPTQQVRLASTRATLRVECPTAGAEVLVGGQRRGTVPWSGSLDAANYKVEVRLDGYRPHQQSVTLSEKENRTLTFPGLQRMVGLLNVNYRPLDAEVLLDGRSIGTTPNIFRDIPVGSHRVEIRKEGYQSSTQSVTITENKQTDLSGSLTGNTAQSAVGSGASGSSANTGLSGQSRETFTVNGVSFTMIRVDGGTFKMGATKAQDSDAYDDESPVHEVTLSTYMMGETEVTQALWKAVMGSNPSNFKGDQNPVESVSWNDCQEFLKKLNTLTGKTFRLPTEAEWEYAARGGSKSRKTKYSGGSDIGSVAWYDGNSGFKTHPVKGKVPNELGIYDMSGNVWEWCSDWYGVYSSSSLTNPKGASSGSYRVYRGGSWGHDARRCRSTLRHSGTPGSSGSYLGLRLAL